MHFSQSGQNLLFTYLVQCTFNLGFGIGRGVTKEVIFCMPINVGHIYFTYPISWVTSMFNELTILHQYLLANLLET